MCNHSGLLLRCVFLTNVQEASEHFSQQFFTRLRQNRLDYLYFGNEKWYTFLSTILRKPELNQKMNRTCKKILVNVGSMGKDGKIGTKYKNIEVRISVNIINYTKER